MNGLFIAVYLVIQILIGVWISRKIKSESDYFLGGRNVSLFLVAFSLFATWFGAETCMGSSGAVYARGLSGSRADPFGFSICLLLMGMLLAARLRRKNYVTLADFFRERYGSGVEKIAVWIMVPSSLIWAAAQLRAFGQIISATTTLPVELTIVFSAVFVIFYTFLGGLLGDIYTDLMQGIIVISGLVLLLGLTLKNGPAVNEVLANMASSRFSLLGPGEAFWERIDRWAVPILGSLVVQEAIARFLAAKNPGVARKSCFIAGGIYFFTGSIPVFLGLIGPRVLPALADSEQFLIRFAELQLPSFLFVVFAGALISAILSTVDSILLAVSALISHNLIFPAFSVTKERKRVLIARLTVALSGILACGIAIIGKGIYNLVLTASAFGTAGVLVITLMGLYSRLGNQAAAVFTLIIGLVITPLGQYVFDLQAPFLTSVAASATAFIIGSFLAAKRARETA